MKTEANNTPEPPTDSPPTASRHNFLLKVGAVAAILAALIRKNISAEYYLLREFGILTTGPTVAPDTATDWFSLLQDQPGLGLVMLDIFDVIYFCIVVFVFVGLCGAFWKTSPEVAGLITTIGVVGAVLSIIPNQCIGLLQLSNQWAAAGTPEQRAMYEAAGEALLAIYGAGTVHQNIAIYLSDIFVPLAALGFAVLMQHDPRFKKSTSTLGIVANGILLTKVPLLLIAPALVFIAPSFSAVFLLVWYVLVGIQMWRASKVA